MSKPRSPHWVLDQSQHGTNLNALLWQAVIAQREPHVTPAPEPTAPKRRPRKEHRPSNYIQQVRDRMAEHPEEVEEIRALLENNKAAPRRKERAQILLAVQDPSIKGCSQLAAALGSNTPRTARIIRRYIQSGVDVLYHDLQRSGRPTKFTPDTVLKLEALLLFSPMQLLQHGLFTCFTQALSGRFLWASSITAALLGIAGPTVITYCRRLGIEDLSENLELCPNPDRDYVGNLLRVDLLRQFGAELGCEVWVYDSMTYTRDCSYNLTRDGKERPESSEFMVLVQPETGKTAATFGHPAAAADLDRLISQLLEARPTVAQRSDELFALPEQVAAIAERHRTEAAAAIAAQEKRAAAKLAAKIKAGKAKYAARKAVEAQVEEYYAPEVAQALERAAAAEAEALSYEDPLDAMFSTLSEVIAREHKVRYSVPKSQRKPLTPEEQELEARKKAARKAAAQALKEAELIKQKVRAHAQAVGELAAEEEYPDVEVEYTEDARVAKIKPGFIMPEQEEVTGLADLKRELVIVVDARAPHAHLWREARQRYPQLEIVFAPQLASSLSPTQQLFYRLENALMTRNVFYGLDQLEQSTIGQIAFYNLAENLRPYPWLLDLLLLINRRIYTQVWGQRNLKALDDIMLTFNEVHYDDATQNELKSHSWATFRHLRKVATAKTKFEFEGLELINPEVWHELAARFTEALASVEPLGHIALTQREPIGLSVEHPDLLSAPAQAAYQSPQQARALLTLLKLRVPNEPYRPTLHELLHS